LPGQLGRIDVKAWRGVIVESVLHTGASGAGPDQAGAALSKKPRRLMSPCT